MSAAHQNDGNSNDGSPNDNGRYAYQGLDRVMHEKARLGILTSLASHQKGLLFGELKDLCHLTDGNLSRHLSVLQEAAMIEIWKGFKGRKPQTLIRLTSDGRQRFLDYVSVLENVVRDAAEVSKKAGPSDLPDGWSIA